MPEVVFHVQLSSVAITLLEGGILEDHAFTLVVDDYEHAPVHHGLRASEAVILGHLLLEAEPGTSTVNASLARALGSLPLADEAKWDRRDAEMAALMAALAANRPAAPDKAGLDRILNAPIGELDNLTNRAIDSIAMLLRDVYGAGPAVLREIVGELESLGLRLGMEDE